MWRIVDGVLFIDKPPRLTSHDVVGAARRALGETRVGHTGTLDPLATGVLPLAIGRATRLVRFLAASDKDYVADVRFGVTTDSYDITGAETGRTDVVPSRDAVLAAIRALTGDYLQPPPPFSAKKVEGRRAYQLARRRQPVALTPAPVRVARANLIECSGACARIALTCSTGFYVRSFAHALGEITGTGACLEALRRTRSGDFSLDVAISMEALQDAPRAGESLVELDDLLVRFPAVTLTDRGRVYVSHGRELGPEDCAGHPHLPLPERPSDDRGPGLPDAPWVRLLDRTGALVALATIGDAPGSLQPSVVLI